MPEKTAKDAASTDAPALSPEELEAQIVATRQRLAGSVDDLAEAANPVALAESAMQKVKGWFVDPDTGVRADRVAKVAGAAVGFVVLRGIVRRGS